MGNRAAVVEINPNHMFIPRHELKKLKEILEEIPAIALELSVTVTKQARLGEVGRGRKPRRPSEQPLPFHIDAAAVADELHNALVGWVRLVCEQRGIEYADNPAEPVWFLPLAWMRDTFVGPLHPQDRRALVVPERRPPTTAELARWLERHLIALGMTEGAEGALDELGELKDRAAKLVCPPAMMIVVDEAKRQQARAMWLNATGIATLAKELGEEYRHLTRRRVHALKRAELIGPVPGPWRKGWPELYKVGDVLDAHLVLPIRERHAKAS